MKKLIYEELTYRIIGILYKVHNKLGPALQEKHYQRAIEVELVDERIPFKKEFGKYYLDFVIDDKIILEIKNTAFFKRSFLSQVLSYLNAVKLKLAILANFNQQKLYCKRIINPKIKVSV